MAKNACCLATSKLSPLTLGSQPVNIGAERHRTRRFVDRSERRLTAGQKTNELLGLMAQSRLVVAVDRLSGDFRQSALAPELDSQGFQRTQFEPGIVVRHRDRPWPRALPHRLIDAQIAARKP